MTNSNLPEEQQDFQYVHIARPARLQYCDNDCKRAECVNALKNETPLLCEAISREDLERAEVKFGKVGINEVLQPLEVYLLGMAFLVLSAEHENRKKYGGKEIGEAIFGFLRATREDVSFEKRLVILLLSVVRTREHFNLGDLETMFGNKIVTLLQHFAPLEDEELDGEKYILRLRQDPLLSAIAYHYYKAKLDWLRLSEPRNERLKGKLWRRCLVLLQ